MAKYNITASYIAPLVRGQTFQIPIDQHGLCKIFYVKLQPSHKIFVITNAATSFTWHCCREAQPWQGGRRMMGVQSYTYLDTDC